MTERSYAVVSYDSLARALDEREIAARVTMKHDEARARYALSSNRTPTYEEFTNQITRYYDYHFATCIAGGGRLAPAEARSEAKQLLEGQLRRGEGDIVTWFVRARDGVEGGLRVALDGICEALKAKAVTAYVRDVFERHVAPQAWEDKVELIRQFIRSLDPSVRAALRADQPDRYAHDHVALIDEYVRGLRRSSAMFRRL
jgi:hypothetical protein